MTGRCGWDSRAPSAPLSVPPLVVCPKSVMDNWHAEAARFTPELRVRVWSASELDRSQATNWPMRICMCSTTANSGCWARAWPRCAGWRSILDEGQYIKNPNSQTAQVARALRAEHRLVLTGTPIENRLLDLWSLMAFAMPGVLGNRAHFARLYDAKDDPFARRRLAARVRPFLLRRTKARSPRTCPTASRRTCSAKSKASSRRSTAPSSSAPSNCCWASRRRRSSPSSTSIS